MRVTDLFKGKTARNLIALTARPMIRLLYGLRKRTLTVIVFHEVLDHPTGFVKERDLTVSAAAFRRQILWVNEHFNIIHPDALQGEKKLPPRAALITFDDGFAGAFENGISFLLENRIPSLMFLNMKSVTEQTPLISVVANFLENFDPAFLAFAKEINLPQPFHLTLNPKVLAMYEHKNGPVDIKKILAYQGPIIDNEAIQKYNGEKLLVFGNHLFEHWNARALSTEEFVEQYQKNKEVLTRFSNAGNFFAFTNGQPDSCFSNTEIQILQGMGAPAIFSSSNSVNLNLDAAVIDRISFRETDDDAILWLRIAKGLKKSLFNRKELV